MPRKYPFIIVGHLTTGLTRSMLSQRCAELANELKIARYINREDIPEIHDDEVYDRKSRSLGCILDDELKSMIKTAQSSGDDSAPEAVKYRSIYKLNSENKQHSNPIPVVDDWDILDQLHRFYKLRPDASVIQSTHLFSLFISSITKASDLAQLEKLLPQLPLLNFNSISDRDAQLCIMLMGGDRPGVRVPYARGFNVREWDIMANADGSNTFFSKCPLTLFQSHYSTIEAEFLLNLEFQVMTPLPLNAKVDFYNDWSDKPKTFQLDEFNKFVCPFKPVVWRRFPLRTKMELKLRVTLPPGQFPQPVFVLCRHERVCLSMKCSQFLQRKLQHFAVDGDEGTLSIVYERGTKSTSEHVIKRFKVQDVDNLEDINF